jgi:flagellar assembly factor FliW
VKINTRKFGEIEIDENKILTMPDGLPGFFGYEKFVLLEDPKTAPFCWFQSVDEPNFALIVMNPFLFKPDYQPNLDEFIYSLGWQGISAQKVLIYVVVNVSKTDGKIKITANLMGPILINPEKHKAVQVILSDTSYSHQHNVLE